MNLDASLMGGLSAWWYSRGGAHTSHSVDKPLEVELEPHLSNAHES